MDKIVNSANIREEVKIEINKKCLFKKFFQQKYTQIFLLFSFIFIDQVIKFLTWNYLKLGESYTVIKNFFYFTYKVNRGAAFSLFARLNHGFIFLGIISLLASILIFYFWFNSKDKYLKPSLFLILAGTIGNGIDRWFYQGVVDMFDFRFGSYYYPVFNLADIFITLGVIYLFIVYFLKEKNS